MVSRITGVSIVYSTVCSGVDLRKHQSSASLRLLGEIHRWPEFPAQRAINAENVSIWWRHRDNLREHLHSCGRFWIQDKPNNEMTSRTLPRHYLIPPWTTWWRHQMETFSALLAFCAENSPVPGEFFAQRPVTRSFDVFFDLHLNKQLSKQCRGWWFETTSDSLWRQCNEMAAISLSIFSDAF